jgi:hypothetical protein
MGIIQVQVPVAGSKAEEYASAGSEPSPARTALSVDVGATTGLEGGADVSIFSSANACRSEEKRRFVVILPPSVK